MEITPQQHRQAFVGWLRTGRWSVPPVEGGSKFNPNHDFRGRFTFRGSGGSGGGGGASGSWHGGGGSFGGGGASATWATP